MGNKMIIVIYDTDDEYIIGINEYLMDYFDDKYSIFTFSNPERFKEFCEFNNNIDIIVMAEYCVDIEFRNKQEMYVQILSEEKNISKIKGYDAVYRYRKASVIISDILNNYVNYRIGREDDNDKNPEKDVNVKLIAIYSPVNRCGKSTLCVKLAEKLKESNSLVVDLNEFSVNNAKFETGMNISDLLYYHLKENNNFNVKLDAVVKKCDGIDIIPPINNISDITEINADIWKNLILKIKNSGKYGYVIVDISNMLGDIFKIFSVCDYVFIPYLTDDYSDMKMKVFFGYLENNNDELKNTAIRKINVSDVLNKGYDYVINEMNNMLRGKDVG